VKEKMSNNQLTRKLEIKLKVNSLYGQMVAQGFYKASNEEVKTTEQEFKKSMEELRAEFPIVKTL